SYDGIAAARSGIVYPHQTSWLQTIVMGPATVSFWTLAENPVGFDAFSWKFTINNSLPPGTVLPGPLWPRPRSTPLFPLPWYQYTYDLGAGPNVLRWTASGYSSGAEAAYVSLDKVSVSAARPLSITWQPYDISVYFGSRFVLNASAIGTPPLRYQWRKNGVNIAHATNASFMIFQCTSANSGVYSLVVSNSQGHVISSNAVVTVLPPAPPFFIREPENITAYVGQNVYLNGYVNGSPPFFGVWQKDGKTIRVQTNWFWLAFTNISLTNAGTYVLRVTNRWGSVTSTNAVVTVLPPVPPSFGDEPQSVTVYSGQNVYLSGDVTGTPPFKYAWKENDRTILTGTNYWDWFSLTLNNVTSTNAGSYMLCVTNRAGGVASTNAIMTVLPPAAPFFTYPPGKITAYSGEDVYLSGAVNGSPPFDFQWVKDGETLQETTSYSWVPAWSTLLLTNVILADAGTYLLYATNNFGAVVSSNAVLTVLPPTAPFFIDEPQSITANEGQWVYLEGGVSGSPPFTYVWQKDGQIVQVQTNTYNQAPSWSMLFLSALTQTNAGTYVLCVTNAYGGIVSTNAVVTVLTTNALPQLSVSARVKQNLRIKGQRGLRYEVQYSEQLINPQWKTLQTVVLTNEAAEINVPASPGSRFFRLKQTN
ncbi:MAG TPA: immunoglobulin domain-containing protein, partial [Verrucomicrobiae bacterium]